LGCAASRRRAWVPVHFIFAEKAGNLEVYILPCIENFGEMDHNHFREMDPNRCVECGGRLVLGSSGAPTCETCGLEHPELADVMSGANVIYVDEAGVKRSAYARTDELGSCVFEPGTLRYNNIVLHNTGEHKLRDAVKGIIGRMEAAKILYDDGNVVYNDACNILRELRGRGVRATEEVRLVAVAYAAVKNGRPVILYDTLFTGRQEFSFTLGPGLTEKLKELWEVRRRLAELGGVFAPYPNRYDPVILVDRMFRLAGYSVEDGLLRSAREICDAVKKNGVFTKLDCEVVAAISVSAAAKLRRTQPDDPLLSTGLAGLTHGRDTVFGRYFSQWRSANWEKHVDWALEIFLKQS